MLFSVNAPADAELLIAVTAGALTRSRTELPVVLETLTNSMAASDVGITEMPFNSILSESVPKPPFNWSKELRVANEPETAALKVSSPLPPVNAVPVSIPVVSELIDIRSTRRQINDLSAFCTSQELSTHQVQILESLKYVIYQ